MTDRGRSNNGPPSCHRPRLRSSYLLVSYENVFYSYDTYSYSTRMIINLRIVRLLTVDHRNTHALLMYSCTPLRVLYSYECTRTYECWRAGEEVNLDKADRPEQITRCFLLQCGRRLTSCNLADGSSPPRQASQADPSNG